MKAVVYIILTVTWLPDF